jgi:twitching motility protein PilJ
VFSSSEEAQTMAQHLAEASANQAHEIVGATTAIQAIAASIEQVSSNAQKSSQVAENSVQLAQAGARVVKDNMQGMDKVRARIQDTSKTLKQLGDSSQEIGHIVSLIDDIADQTNILALNAAIQAAMAGEAGRGFAVVADEVQRLAERSGQAAKQIENLVRTIQKNTQETLGAMTDVNNEVTAGTRLAHDAATALESIETVSKQLAEHTHTISLAAQEQVKSSTKVSSTMGVIQEITTQTASGSSATVESMNDLVKVARELKGSVSGFKLPNVHKEGEAV